MSYGSMIYNTAIPQVADGAMLHINGHDFVQVFINGEYIGKIDRVKNERSLPLPATHRKVMY